MSLPAHERLTTSQFKFAKAYAQLRDPKAAYLQSYNPKEMADETMRVEASRILANPKVALRIEQEIAELEALTGFTPAAALNAFLDIATADPRELIELKVGCCRHCYGADGAYQWDEPSYLQALRDIDRLPASARKDAELPDVTGGFGYDPRRAPAEDCVSCAGNGVQRVVPKDTSNLSRQALLLYGGVKQTRNGIEIIIADRTKALENAARIIGAFKDNVRLDGTIPAMVDVIMAAQTDPIEASRMYQDLMRRTAPNGRSTAH